MAKQQASDRVHLKADQIPQVHKEMPVLLLGGSVSPAEQFLSDTIRRAEPRTEERILRADGAKGIYSTNGRLAAFVNPATGETQVFPSMEALEPTGGIAKQSVRWATEIAKKAGIFPDDGTHAVALSPISVLAASYRRDRKRTRPREHLVYQRFRRHVDGVPVFGPGTRATLAVGADKTVHGLVHRWRAAIGNGLPIRPKPTTTVARSIVRQLASSAKHADVTVNKVSLAYFDNGEKVLQPVYRYHATVVSRPLRGHTLRAADRHLVGYVSIGEPAEPLPVLGRRASKRPTRAGANGRKRPPVPPGDPTVGRYVVRNDSDEWVDSANEFLDGLNEAVSLFNSPRQFTDAQYYWAYPRLFENDKDSFVNSVHIALNEVHGNWGWFSTRDNSDDGVSISAIPAPGYGPGPGGGSLGYWIIHSCEVIPTQADEATSFDVWWNIFNGMHAVVGYRTSMWIDDDVTGPFGLAIGLGASVVPAWLNEVASNDSYDDGDTYHDDNRNMDEPMGRASAVVVCGHSDDTVDDTVTTGSPDCLTEWWFDN